MTTMFRRALVVGALLALGLLALPALGQEDPPPDEPPADAQIFDIVFPVAGPNSYTDTWGEARSGGRTHEGTDIMADKGIPVVAAADGVVGWIGTTCCYFELEHDGFETWYIHLNNDTPGTDDGLGWGIAEGIETGSEVTAGQLIGWVGDSGNAEWSGPHLHFEIRVEGTAVNSYWSLLQASPPPETLMVNPWNGTFADDDASPHEADIETLAAAGITKGCNPPANTNYCPQRLITRGEIAAFIHRTLELPAADRDAFVDDGGSVFEANINAITAAGIGFGCTETDFCPDQPLLRDEMAEMLVRAFAAADPERYSNPDDVDYFTDDEASEWQDSINLLMAAGVTKGCNPPDNDNYCPDRPLIRAELASFFVRALGG
jgi:murein DD-endopeptidase MepM/ murein hydrolase activator NlpD